MSPAGQLWGRLGAGIALALAGFHLYTALAGVLSPLVQRSVHLLPLMALVFLRPRAGRAAPGPLAWAWLGLIAALAVFLVEALSPARILERGIAGPTPWEVAMGAALVLAVLEGTRRAVGWPIVAVALGFLAYAVAGPWLPALVAHRGYGLERLVSYLVWSTEGVFTTPLAVSASFVAVFIIFGGLLDTLGAGQFFIDLARGLTGRLRGGPALTSVVASGLMGSISGSSVSNVVTTGAFTIPLMIRTGYTPRFAAAVEAAASTGGQILPPVMGAAAFVMAELVGVPYYQVALAAAVPAGIYFAAVGFMVYFRARRRDLAPPAGADQPALGETLRKGGHLLIPLGVLVWLLVAQGLSPMRSGFFAILTLVAVASIKSLIADGRLPWREVLAGLEKGARATAPVALACAAAGLVIGVVSLTGLGVRFTGLVVDLAGGRLWLGSILTMVACLVLGMGLPTTAAYVITAVLGAPALIALGVEPLAAHLFILYFAIISFITPPVAISAFAAAGLAGTGPMATAAAAFRLGLAGFLAPYVFLYLPGILGLRGVTPLILQGLTALAGAAGLAGALEGWWGGRLGIAGRLAALAAALALVAPSVWWGLAGLAALAALWRLASRRPSPAA